MQPQHVKSSPDKKLPSFSLAVSTHVSYIHGTLQLTKQLNSPKTLNQTISSFIHLFYNHETTQKTTFSPPLQTHLHSILYFQILATPRTSFILHSHQSISNTTTTRTPKHCCHQYPHTIFIKTIKPHFQKK